MSDISDNCPLPDESHHISLEEETLIFNTDLDDKVKANVRYLNAMKFTELELIKREADIKDLILKYPHIPEMWITLVWNYVNSNPAEEIDRLIKSRAYDGKPNPRVVAGSMKGLSVEEKPAEALLE
jgi:hypothetical protein